MGVVPTLRIATALRADLHLSEKRASSLLPTGGGGLLRVLCEYTASSAALVVCCGPKEFQRPPRWLRSCCAGGHLAERGMHQYRSIVP